MLTIYLLIQIRCLKLQTILRITLMVQLLFSFKKFKTMTGLRMMEVCLLPCYLRELRTNKVSYLRQQDPLNPS